MDHRTDTIDRHRSPLGQSRALAASGRLSPEPARAAGLPVGRSEALEAVADALDTRSLGRLFRAGHAKRKRRAAAAEFHIQLPPGATHKDARLRAASAIASWGALLTGTPCARDGTPDGRPGRVGAWWITLGEAAWRDELHVEACSGDWWRKVLDLYPGWARPPAEERA